MCDRLVDIDADMLNALETLRNLEIQRGLLCKDGESLMKRLIDGLVEKGIYPSKPTKAMEKNGYSILDMVKAWGARWCYYEEPLECPYCKANLKDEENGPPFKREIAINDFFCDGTIDCICPDCYRSLNNGKQYDREAFEQANNASPLE